MGITMTETKTLRVVKPSDRVIAGVYADNKGMTPATGAKYRAGKADDTVLLQTLAQYREELEVAQAERIASLEHANSAYIAEIDTLKTRNANQATNISNLCSQLDSVKNENTAKKEEISFFNKALLAIKTRAQGSIFGKGKDIVKLVDDAVYIPGE